MNNNCNILCVIPSRIASTRLPRKALLPILGKPMVQWTYENAAKCSFFSDVIVATDSDEIRTVIESVGGKVMMTDPAIPTGSERVASVAQHFKEADVVVNLQGDEPFVTPAMLHTLVTPYLAGEKPTMTTLAYPLAPADRDSPSIVKVIIDLRGNALYFSRAAIPYYRTEHRAPAYHHVGLYAFTRDFLLAYAKLPQTPLELTESLEQLRVLEHGYQIRVCVTDEKTVEVNTQEEYETAKEFARMCFRE